jgi:hypothetical protein
MFQGVLFSWSGEGSQKVLKVYKEIYKNPKLARLRPHWCVGVPLDKMVVDEEREGVTSTSLMLIRDGRIIPKYVFRKDDNLYECVKEVKMC